MEQSQEKFKVELEKAKTEIQLQKTGLNNASTLKLLTDRRNSRPKEVAVRFEAADIPEEEDYQSPLKKSARKLSTKKPPAKNLSA